MKKLPSKFKAPLTGLLMMTYMISTLPLLLVYLNAPEGAPIFEIYKTSLKNALTNVVPYALMLAVPGIITFNIIVSRFLVQKEEK